MARTEFGPWNLKRSLLTQTPNSTHAALTTNFRPPEEVSAWFVYLQEVDFTEVCFVLAVLRALTETLRGWIRICQSCRAITSSRGNAWSSALRSLSASRDKLKLIYTTHNEVLEVKCISGKDVERKIRDLGK